MVNTFIKLPATLAIAMLANAPLIAAAQAGPSFPSRPVRLVVPTPAGGPSDAAARLVAQALTTAWGRQVVVENKPGVGGAIAAQAVMPAAPDGYTLLWGLSSMAGLPAVQKSPPYRHMNELVPVSNVVQFGYALYANNDVPAKTFAELVTYGRAHPDKLSYATGTLGEYMMGEHVLKSAGIKAVRVPYKGDAQLMPDLISGQVQLNVGPIPSGLRT